MNDFLSADMTKLTLDRSRRERSTLEQELDAFLPLPFLQKKEAFQVGPARFRSPRSECSRLPSLNSGNGRGAYSFFWPTTWDTKMFLLLHMHSAISVRMSQKSGRE